MMLVYRLQCIVASRGYFFEKIVKVLLFHGMVYHQMLDVLLEHGGIVFRLLI
jgi:hypothetical protein